MNMSTIFLIIFVIRVVVTVSLVVLLFRALLKYLRTEDQRKEAREIRLSLSEVLREHRVKAKMTQEFVAETLGVSRQAVSKWERGESEPSTSNLIAVAKLYGITAEQLLSEVEK